MPLESAPVTTEAEFHSHLEALIAEALANGVDIEAPWDCHNTTDQYDYEALISAVNSE